MNHRERAESISNWIQDQEKTRKQIEIDDRNNAKQMIAKATKEYHAGKLSEEKRRLGMI